MKLLIVAVGQRVPDWSQTAYEDYAKRFPPELKVELKAVKTEPRGSKTLETLYAAERERIEGPLRVAPVWWHWMSAAPISPPRHWPNGSRAGSWAETMWRWSSAAPTASTRLFVRLPTNASVFRT